MVLNDTPHSVHLPKLVRPKVKAPPLRERIARLEEKLRAGRLLRRSQAPRVTFSFDDTGEPVSKALVAAVERKGNLAPKDSPLFDDGTAEAQLWGWIDAPTE